MELPYDIARCTGFRDGVNCPLRDNCKRFTDPGHPSLQVMIAGHWVDRNGATCAYKLEGKC